MKCCNTNATSGVRYNVAMFNVQLVLFMTTLIGSYVLEVGNLNLKV